MFNIELTGADKHQYVNEMKLVYAKNFYSAVGIIKGNVMPRYMEEGSEIVKESLKVENMSMGDT